MSIVHFNTEQSAPTTVPTKPTITIALKWDPETSKTYGIYRPSYTVRNGSSPDLSWTIYGTAWVIEGQYISKYYLSDYWAPNSYRPVIGEHFIFKGAVNVVRSHNTIGKEYYILHQNQVAAGYTNQLKTFEFPFFNTTNSNWNTPVTITVPNLWLRKEYKAQIKSLHALSDDTIRIEFEDGSGLLPSTKLATMTPDDNATRSTENMSYFLTTQSPAPRILQEWHVNTNQPELYPSTNTLTGIHTLEFHQAPTGSKAVDLSPDTRVNTFTAQLSTEPIIVNLSKRLGTPVTLKRGADKEFPIEFAYPEHNPLYARQYVAHAALYLKRNDAQNPTLLIDERNDLPAGQLNATLKLEWFNDLDQTVRQQLDKMNSPSFIIKITDNFGATYQIEFTAFLSGNVSRPPERDRPVTRAQRSTHRSHAQRVDAHIARRNTTRTATRNAIYAAQQRNYGDAVAAEPYGITITDIHDDNPPTHVTFTQSFAIDQHQRFIATTPIDAAGLTDMYIPFDTHDLLITNTDQYSTLCATIHYQDHNTSTFRRLVTPIADAHVLFFVNAYTHDTDKTFILDEQPAHIYRGATYRVNYTPLTAIEAPIVRIFVDNVDATIEHTPTLTVTGTADAFFTIPYTTTLGRTPDITLRAYATAEDIDNDCPRFIHTAFAGNNKPMLTADLFATITTNTIPLIDYDALPVQNFDLRVGVGASPLAAQHATLPQHRDIALQRAESSVTFSATVNELPCYTDNFDANTLTIEQLLRTVAANDIYHVDIAARGAGLYAHAGNHIQRAFRLVRRAKPHLSVLRQIAGDKIYIQDQHPPLILAHAPADTTRVTAGEHNMLYIDTLQLWALVNPQPLLQITTVDNLGLFQHSTLTVHLMHTRTRTPHFVLAKTTLADDAIIFVHPQDPAPTAVAIEHIGHTIHATPTTHTHIFKAQLRALPERRNTQAINIIIDHNTHAATLYTLA